MSSSSVIQQALTDNNNNQDEASWSLYDYGDMYANDEFMHRDAIVHNSITSISLYERPRDLTTQSALRSTDYTDKDWEKIGIAIGECSKLKKLDLVGVKLKKSIIKCLFDNRGPHAWPDFNVVKADQGVMGLRALLPALKSFPSLDTLDLSGCCGLGIQAAKLVGDVLKHTKISNLVLEHNRRYHHNNLKDDGLKCILEASNAKHLVRLNIGGGYTQAGFDAISNFLRRDDSQLRILGVTTEKLGAPGMKQDDIECMFIESIRIQNKSNLEVLTMGCWYSGLKGIVKEKMLTLVCNTENIQSLVDSNHHFCALGYSGWGGTFDDNNCDPIRRYDTIHNEDCKDLSHIFEINKETLSPGGSSAKAIRRKVRNFYFQLPEFDVTYFVDMDANLLPYVLDLVTRIEYRDGKWLDSRWSNKKEPFLVPSYNNLNGIYRLVKNCPVALFSFPSPHELLKQKDDTISQLKAANETMRLQLEKQAREIELLKLGGPTPSNKRAKTGDNKETKSNSAGGDIESRLAALEADVALLKQK